MGCSDEHHAGCGHGHAHGGAGHDHELDGDAGEQQSLLLQVDLDHVVCLNETTDGAVKGVFRPYAERFAHEPVLESDADEQLLITIPFVSAVKLKAIALVGGPEGHTPASMRAYANCDNLDFTSADAAEPDQTWELVPPSRGSANTPIPEYRTRVARFSNLRCLTLLIDTNFGSDTTRIFYIGLHGEYSNFTRDPIITTYEAAANPADHKNKALQSSSHAVQ